MKIIMLVCTLLLSVNAYSQSELTFAQAYKKFNQAYQDNNLSERIKYSKLAFTLGAEKYGKESKTSYVLALNWAVSLAEENNRRSLGTRAKLFSYVIDGYQDLYGADSEKLIEPYIYYHKTVKQGFKANKKNKNLKRVIAGLEAINKKVEPGSLTQAQLLQVIADCYNNIHKAATASELFQASYDIYSKKLASTDSRLGLAAFHMGKISNRQDRHYDAKKYFEQALQVFTSSDGRNTQLELGTRAFLISTLELMGDSDEATEHCLTIGKMTPWNPNQEQKPLYRIQPKYPPKAAKKRIEGWVKLSYSISPTGFVEDINIFERSNPDRIFDKVSKKALKKWRFAPKFVDGKAVKAENLTVQLDYTMG